MVVSHGRFISVEGGEGVGKSSFLKGLEEYLQEAGVNVVATREPGGTPTAQAIRQVFMSPPQDDPLDPKSELFLVSAARCQHLEKLIKPSIAQGKWVLCDRFHDSTRVYQGIGGGVPQDELETLIKLSVGSWDPELTFLLDCDVQVALQRVAQRIESDESGNRYDEASVAFHETLRAGFLGLSKRFSERFVILDAEKSQGEVLQQAVAEIESRFGIKV